MSDNNNNTMDNNNMSDNYNTMDNYNTTDNNNTSDNKLNCIFICVFNQEKFIDMLYLLLESIFIYGNLNNNTEILIYTSTEFMNIIKSSHLNNEIIKFEINDTYNNIDKACKSRLDIFELESVNRYQKILYIDTDILVKDDINKVFDVCKDNILYVLEEGDLETDEFDYYGKSLFTEEELILLFKNYNDTTAFTSGILLFNNCKEIKELFNNIKLDMVNRPYNFSCYDQPYIVYNAFKYNLFNNKILKSFVVNNDLDINSDKVIHHFPGLPGSYIKKLNKMSTFLNEIKEHTINININKAKSYIDNNLVPIIKKTGELLEGNIFMYHNTYNYIDKNLYKARNISNLLLNKNIKNVMEIGFNSGFSTLLMLISNPNIHITCFDIEHHRYVKPCYEKLKDTYGDRINLILGDSTKTVNKVNGVYDLIHIDGGHLTNVAKYDIINSYILSKEGTILIMDDYNFTNLNILWDMFVKNKNLKPLDINLYKTNDHDIKYIYKKDKNIIYDNILNEINNIIIDNMISNDMSIISNHIVPNIINIIPNIVNKSYSWKNSKITFLDNYKIKANVIGEYKCVNKTNIVVAKFGGRIYTINFNDNYTSFQSIRKGDSQVVNGNLLS